MIPRRQLSIIEPEWGCDTAQVMIHIVANRMIACHGGGVRGTLARGTAKHEAAGPTNFECKSVNIGRPLSVRCEWLQGCSVPSLTQRYEAG